MTDTASTVSGHTIPDVPELMAMPIAERTDVLERLAHHAGLETAPGERHEGQMLSRMLAGFKANPLGGMLDPEVLPLTLWAHYMKAPLTLIKLLKLFHPHLLRLPRPLRILYVGADQSEVLDEGRWLTMAWLLQNISPHAPYVTAVGPALANASEWERSPWRSMVAAAPQQMMLLPGTLEQALSTEDACVNWEEAFDVVVMHHPGFVANMHNWWQDAAWMDLAGFADIPIIGTSFDDTDLHFDTMGLAASGRIVDRVWWNPTAHIGPANQDHGHNQLRTRLQWGGVLWSTRRDPQFVENQFSHNQDIAMDWFESVYTRLHERGGPLAFLVRWHYSCPMQFDTLRHHLLVSDDIRIEVATGRVHAFGQTAEAGPVTRSVLNLKCLEDRLYKAPEVLCEIAARIDVARVRDEYPDRALKASELAASERA